MAFAIEDRATALLKWTPPPEPCVRALTRQDDIPGDCMRVLNADQLPDDWGTCTSDVEYLVTCAPGLVAGLCAEHAEEFRRDAPSEWWTSIERLVVAL